jgi:hypothetical protein
VKTRIAAVLAWLVAGHLVVGGLFWLLLQVPESNVFMLTASLVIVLLGVLVLGVIEEAGLLALSPADPWGSVWGPALRRSWLIVLPLAVFGVAWFATAHITAWHEAHHGEIDAWFITKFGATKTDAYHATIVWFTRVLRYGIGVALSVALLASVASQGLAGVAQLAWLRRAFNWRLLLTVGVAMLVGLWLPWQGVYWRPASLPNAWQQPAFAALKLCVLFVVANTAWAAILLAASSGRVRVNR